MRLLVVSIGALCAAFFGVTCAVAQSGQWGQAEDQTPPYHTHVDRRFGHDHVYPDHGAVVRDVPDGALAVNYAGISYRFAGGVWYEPLGRVYVVVAPPIGLIVPQLPAFATSLDRGGKTYLYADDVFYNPRPDLGGYEVINDPVDTAYQQPQAPAAASPSVTPAPVPGAAARPAATPQAVQASASVTPAATAIPAATVTPAATPAQNPIPATSAAAAPAISSGVSASVAPALANPTRVVVSAHNGQGADQQATDRYQCYRFAVAQSGFDPLASNSAATAQGRSDYSRAQAACLEGRGYTVE